jgi:hypothetical protein
MVNIFKQDITGLHRTCLEQMLSQLRRLVYSWQWMMTRYEFGRQSVISAIPAHVWTDWGKHLKFSIRTAGNQAEIRTFRIYLSIYIYIYIKRLGIFPLELQLFQSCKSETQPINTKSVVQHVIRCQVFWWHITKPIPSIVAVVQKVDSFLYV